MSSHRLASVELGVPDVEASARFFEAFGLAPSAQSGTDLSETRSFATRDGGEQLRLSRVASRGISRIGVAVDDADDLARIEHRLLAAAHRAERVDRKVVTCEPVTGVEVSFEIAARISAPTSAPGDVANAPGAAARLNRPARAITATEPVRPSSLAHVVLGTPDQPATLAFLTSMLGFEISDELPGVIAFTRCGDSHHHVAIQSAPVAMLHHVAFEVDTVDDVARGGSELIRADPDRQLWGLGRHAIGSNWFWYLREPNGHYVEYTADIDQITAQELYQPKQWSGHEYLYSMGQPPPDAFLEPDDLADLFAAQQP